MMLQDQPITASEIVEERRLRALYRESERDCVTQQITEESTGQWYLIRCEPGRDLTVKRWLGDRRKFGVFLPMNGLKRVLPGWLCAYVFDMPQMQERILACPGVVGILRCHKELPLRLDVDFIHRLAKEAWVGKDHLPAPRPRTAVKRLNKRNRKAIRKAKMVRKRARLSGILDTTAQISAFRLQQLCPRGAA